MIEQISHEYEKLTERTRSRYDKARQIYINVRVAARHAQRPELFTAITSVCCTGIGDVGYGSNDEKSEDNASSTGSSKQGSRPVSAQAWVAASDPLFNIGIDEVSLSLSYFIPQHGIHRKYRWN